MNALDVKCINIFIIFGVVLPKFPVLKFVSFYNFSLETLSRIVKIYSFIVLSLQLMSLDISIAIVLASQIFIDLILIVYCIFVCECDRIYKLSMSSSELVVFSNMIVYKLSLTGIFRCHFGHAFVSSERCTFQDLQCQETSNIKTKRYVLCEWFARFGLSSQ